jgi:hypothetical protein
MRYKTPRGLSPLVHTRCSSSHAPNRSENPYGSPNGLVVVFDVIKYEGNRLFTILSERVFPCLYLPFFRIFVGSTYSGIGGNPQV